MFPGVHLSNRKNPGNTKYVFDGHWLMEIDGLYKFCLIFFWEEFDTEAKAMADQAQWHYGVY